MNGMDVLLFAIMVATLCYFLITVLHFLIAMAIDSLLDWSAKRGHDLIPNDPDFPWDLWRRL